MKFISLGIVVFALTFCGLSERLKKLTGGTNSNAPSTSSNTSSNSSSPSSPGAEKANLTPAQQTIADSGTETKWDDQGISWRLPASWKKTDVKKDAFDYASPDNAFLLVNISEMPDSFPMDVSQKAYYDNALAQVKSGKYTSAKLVEIDGITGVEFTEAPPEGKDGIRRHQWIAYRTYQGHKQQVNVMTSTSAEKFDKHADEFQAILYSAKFTK